MVPKCAAVDSRAAADYLRQPGASEASFPFAKGPARGTIPPASGSGTSSKKRGKQPAHSDAQAKYAGGRVPKEIKRLLKNSWPLLECMKKGKWGKSFNVLCSHGLAKSTWGKYTAAVRLFKKFCREQGEKFKLPISPAASNSWIVWAAGSQQIGASTMKAYLAALHSIGRIFEAGQGGRGAEKLLLAGAENLARHTKAQRPKRAPLTFVVLKRLVSEIERKNWRHLSKLVVRAFCCVGYFGSFRAGELLAKDSWSFDRFSDLTWGDVTMDTDEKGGNNSMTLHVKETKTRLAGGEKVELFRFEDPQLCPVRLLERLVAAQKAANIWDKDGPVFRFKSGKNLTVSRASKMMKILLKNTEFKGENLSASSLRAGVPTDMESRPDLFKDTQIKSWGRWRSGAYRHYMKREDARKRDIYRRLSCMLCKWI